MPELLNPAGLAWLALLPLLLVPYLLQQRPRRRVVPALFLYAGIGAAERLRLGGRLRLRPLFFVQLLLLLTAIAALCRPVLRTPEIRSALVIDDSASMQTIDERGESRFAQAQRAARAELAHDAANTWDVYQLSPAPRPAGTGLSSDQARSTVDGLSAGGCAHPDDALLASFFDRLSRRGYASVHVVSDRTAASSERFRIVSVGRPQPNLAITDVSLAPSALAGQPIGLNVVVENFSPRDRQVPVEIRDAAGARVASGTVALEAHGSASFATDVPDGARFRARISTGDGLAIDDEATALSARTETSNVLLVSHDSGGLDAVAKLLGARLEVVTPEAYRPELAAGRDLVIFHRAAPREPPAAAALYLLPPDVPYLPPAASRVDAPTIAFPAATHAVARYLNAAAIRPRQALTLRADPRWQALALANGGAVIAERQAASLTVISGLDLLPYLGDRNRPVSILTLNLLSWLLHARGPRPAETACTPIGRIESNLEQPPELPPAPATDGRAEETVKTRPLWRELTSIALLLLLLDAWVQRAAGAVAWAMRAVVVLLVVFAWLDPTRATAAPPLRPTAVVDVSRSVLSSAREQALRELARFTDPTATAIAFGARARRSTLAEMLQSAASADDGASDIEAALYAAAADAPPGGLLYLVTDGWENRGQALRAVDVLARRKLRVDPIAAPQTLAGDVALRSLSLPAESPSGAAVRAEALLYNDNPRAVRGRLSIRRGGTEVVHEDVTLPPGDTVVSRPLLLAGEGLLEFTAEFTPADPATDAERDNDRAKAWVAAAGGRRLLLVGHEERENRTLAHTLTQRGFRVTSVARASGEPMPDPAGHAAVILNDVPLADLPESMPRMLREFVRGGGGLAMIGGPRSFGLGGYRDTPIEEALPVRMKERRRDEPRNAVALVIDKSGSMREEHRISYARESARQLVEHLKDHDRITVIGFDRESFVVVPLSEVGEIRDDFASQIDRLKPSGGTRLYPALEEARRQLLGEEAKRRHIIVLSDGLSEDAENAFDRRRYYDLALALSDQGVTISTVALGHDADADFLERLASFGRGAFHQTADASSLPDIVLGEFEEHGREKTLSERRHEPSPSRESPLIGELARADARWPEVLGLVETELKPAARRDVGVSDSDSPLIASWEYGRGRAVAVTTDADGRWSDSWLRWKEWSRLWSDVVGWIAPESRAQQGRYAVAYRDGALEIEYSRFDQDPGGAISARIATPDRPSTEIALPRAAVGSYRGRFPTRAPGDYRIEIRGPHGPLTQTPLGFTIAPSVVDERSRREPNWALLEELARRTGGAMNPALDRIRASAAPPTKTPLSPFILPAAMMLFLIELIVRRLRANESHR